MASFNRVVLMGNLTRDIELRYIPNGTAVAEFGLAVNDRRKTSDGWVDDPSFFDIVHYGRTAEVASEYLSKGSPCLDRRSIETRHLGKRRTETLEGQGHRRANANDRFENRWWRRSQRRTRFRRIGS